MKIVFNYYAQIRRAAGAETECVEVAAGATLLETLKTMDHGAEFAALLFDAAGAPQPVILYLVNGRAATPEQRLSDGDHVSVFSPVAGG